MSKQYYLNSIEETNKPEKAIDFLLAASCDRQISFSDYTEIQNLLTDKWGIEG